MMMKLLLPILLIGSHFVAISQPFAYKQIDSLMQAEVTNQQFSGVLLVASNGKIRYNKAFGYRDFAKQVTLKNTDIFELASVSKQFTAMIIMMLKEKGLLSYDDPVEKYLQIPYKGITIRQLLTHTSGLPDYQQVMDQHWDKSRVAGNADILEFLNKYAPPKNAEPGVKYEYSNTGYVLLASIAEKASGKDFIDMCRTWIFRPLNMKNTDIRTPAEKSVIKNFAIGHFYVAEKGRYIRADSFPSSDYTIWLGNRKGPGRISSTVEDLLKWDQALYTERLIKQSTLKEAFMPMTLKDGGVSNYGFGWTIKTEAGSGTMVQHSGDNPGYKTMIVRYVASNKTIILFSNNSHKDFGAMLDFIKKLIQ